MARISVLIITEYEGSYIAPKDIDIFYYKPELFVKRDEGKEDADIVEEVSEPVIPKLFDIVIADRNLKEDELEDVLKHSQVHRVFYTEKVTARVNIQRFKTSYCAKTINSGSINDFLFYNGKYFYRKPYGEKYELKNLTVSRNFKGKVTGNGNNGLTLEGNFSDNLSQVLFFRNNIPVNKGQEIDFWLEYSKTGNVEISFEITAFLSGSISTVVDRTECSEGLLRDVVTYGGFDSPVNIFISIKAKGEGTLTFIALHDRFSRGNNGSFLIGGERYVTQKREEVFAYFEPGDLKPPLNIYFSGYKTKEGFEGYNLMKNLGSPFLLIAETRLEGGAFYIGDEEYESIILKVIKDHMNILGFEGKDVLISGLSMGSFGALYYACDFAPHAVLLGKPLASIGDVALNERRFRPGGFPTSLDVIKKNSAYFTGNIIEAINEKLWKKYEKADWSGTKFVVAYMIEDDYDSTAYGSMISRIKSSGAAIYGKGIHGRHNDNTSGIINWFLGQFVDIMRDEFGRDNT